jgi:hypothetical protein
MTEQARTDSETELERYYTPEWVTRVLIEHTNGIFGYNKVGEPCAGQGHIAETIRRHNKDVIASDIDPESPYESLDATNRHQMEMRYADCDVIVTNPPYNAETGSASDVISTLLELDLPLIALLRITYLEPCMDRVGILSKLDRVVTLPRFDFEMPDKRNNDKGNPATSCWFMWNIDDSNGIQQSILPRRRINELLGQTTIFDNTSIS